MYHSYSLTRAWDGEDVPFAQSFTTSDDDAINCAHMLAAGFNTMSRNFTNGFVLAVVDTTAGTVQYDGKTEQIKRDDPWSVSTTLHFTADPDGDSMATFLGEGERVVFPGKLSFAKNDAAAESLAKSAAGHIARSVLEEAYAELQAVQNVLFEAGVETIPADAGVRDLVSMTEQLPYAAAEKIATAHERIAELEKRDEHERHARQNMQEQYEQANRSAVVEMVEYVKKAHVKLERIDPAGDREDLQGRMRGMLDVLAKFLVVMGEADHDERHAVARRLCEIGD